MKISSRARPTVSPCAATAASNSRQNSLCLQTPTPPTSSLYGLIQKACCTLPAALRPRSFASIPTQNLLSSSTPPISLRKRSEEHTSELQSRLHLVCRLLLEKKK